MLSTNLRAALLVAVLAAGTPASLAQEMPATEPAEPAGMGSGCAAFKWPLDKERAAFESAGLESVASGAARGTWKEQAFALALAPAADVAYTLPPHHGRKEEASPRFGGIVAFAAPEKPGTYQVTLSSEGWVDVVQNGTAAKSVGHSGAKGCPGSAQERAFQRRLGAGSAADQRRAGRDQSRSPSARSSNAPYSPVLPG
ncbi:MAG: hypothetical protein WDN31_08540 [Hyphomicrobium sp.]